MTTRLSQKIWRDDSLTLHLGVLVGRLEVLVVFLVLIVVHGSLLSSPGVVNLGTASATSALNNVVQINLL
ncbi:hypothetical protein TGAMA5MH_06966 [Trichoderma gamsii]|uniref:Uncharacterized protein n=1 Tax=Trichoderma gamsii TaxID=398673 RepID=A0A2K0T6E5_9HYPO|nr:hypothetical protein TGAMA5MH_06966 [Trichoderma gamsii]